MDYEDVLYSVHASVATITSNRPKAHNAFRPRTCAELIDAFQQAGRDREVGAIVLTGAGDNIRGVGALGMQALKRYYDPAESKEGVEALKEKRKPEFRKHLI